MEVKLLDDDSALCNRYSYYIQAAASAGDAARPVAKYCVKLYTEIKNCKKIKIKKSKTVVYILTLLIKVDILSCKSPGGGGEVCQA